jgi:hypothetical protein
MGPKRYAVAFLMLMGPAAAQPARTPTENVTVTGTKSREAIKGFIQSFTAPARITGKIARWEDRICPITVGLPAGFTKFVTQRVKDVAARVGAPVNDKESCKHNIAVVFTAAPQALLDKVRKNQPWFLGYHDSSAQADQMAKVTHAIQAWYTTATIDVNGNPQFDAGGMQGGIKFYAVTGNRTGDGLRSTFYDVIIVVDPNTLVDYEIGSLADYIAMLALTQSNALDTCQQLPSIVNMLAAGCERKSDALTDNDLAYLRGLYKMNADRTWRSQRDEIAYQMKRSLEGK